MSASLLDDLRARPGSVRILGRRFECAWIGPSPEDAPTIVFLHEALGSVSTWRGFPARLAAASRCGALVYGRPGHGASDAPKAARTTAYLHEEALEVLPAVLARFGIESPFLFGHSDGATIALLFAAAHPATRAVVAEAPHVFVEEESLTGIRRAAEAYAAGRLREKLARHHGKATDALFHAWADTWLSPAFRDWNVEDALGAISCPVLVVQGEEDGYATLAQVASVVSRVAGEAFSLVLPECGHAPHSERPGEVLSAAAALFSRR